MSHLRECHRSLSPTVVWIVVAVGTAILCVVLMAMQGAADDVDDPAAPKRQHPPHGTQFWFEVIESFNAKYEGDTPGHIGRGGGITLHPHVALGDLVHHRIGDEDKAVGVITGLTWDRLKGSLTVEFRPKEDHRIAVGDEVWIDLNPLPRLKESRDADRIRQESRGEQNAQSPEAGLPRR